MADDFAAAAEPTLSAKPNASRKSGVKIYTPGNTVSVLWKL
jgi:hypothetical protein